MGLGRDEVYIANVIKCRPPGNRNPEPDEVADLRAVPVPADRRRSQPKVDRRAGHLRRAGRCSRPTSRSRGCAAGSSTYRGAKLIPTFHPAFLLRSPGYKRDVWDDMKNALGAARPPSAGRRRAAASLRIGADAPRSPSPFPFPRSARSPTSSRTACRCRSSARACSCRSGRAPSPASSSTRRSRPPADARRRESRSSRCSTPSPFLPADVVRLALWVADYYACRARRGAGDGDAAPRLGRERALRADHRRRARRDS